MADGDQRRPRSVPEARRERGEGTAPVNLKGEQVHRVELTGESHDSGGGTDPGEEMRQPVIVVR
jgi:hypothetical protein